MEGDLSGPQGASARIRLVVKKVLALQRYPAQRLPGRAGGRLTDPGEGERGDRAAHEGLATAAQRCGPPGEPRGRWGVESHKGLSCPWSHGLEAWLPKKP